MRFRKSRKKPLTLRAQNILTRMRYGETLCREVDATQATAPGGNFAYWLEPSGKRVGPAGAFELISKNVVMPSDDGLLPELSQTYRAPT